jgi:uncharacterized protein
MRGFSFILIVSSLFLCASVIAQQPAASAAKAPSAHASSPSPAAPAKAQSAPAATGNQSAPQVAATSDKPTAAQVLRLLQLLRVRDELRATLDTMKQQMKGEAEQMFRDKIPNPTAEQLKSVNGILDQSFAELSLDDLINDLVPIYQRHLSRSDVQALVAFYTSPPGQKILREQPAILRESMQAAGNGQQKRMEVMLAKVEVRMQQLIDQEQGKPGPEKK